MADPVWLMVMFDLPVKTKDQRRQATDYRNMLFDKGFTRVQYSVYSKYLINGTAAIPLIGHLKATVPPAGYVRIIQLTDKQWAGGWHLFGSEFVAQEEPPDDLLLF